MITAHYVDDILQPALLPYPQGHLDVLFQHDNTRPHIARRTTDFLQEADVNIFLGPSRSPDLNPIEYVWDMTQFHEVEVL